MPGRLLETLPLQRRRPGQQLVEDHAQGVDVRPRVHVEVVELGLFRTHVERRAQYHAVGRVQRALGERLLDRLGQPEVDHFRHRMAVVQADQDVAGLQVSVDHALGVGVLHGLADRYEECETLGDGQAGVVAILGEGDALDVLHDEERPARLGRAAVQHLGDVRVVHQSQGLPLRLEPGQHGPRVHSRPDELECHDPPNRLCLLGLPDRAHSPCANLLEQPVAAGEHGADALARGNNPGGCWTGGDFRPAGRPCRLVEDPEGFQVRREQLLDPPSQCDIAGTRFFQECLPLGRGRLLQGRDE